MPSTPRMTQATAQGMRAEQQDRYVVAKVSGPPAGTLRAVMDGHGGPEAADVLAGQIVPLFERARLAHPSEPLAALEDTFRELERQTQSEESGSTLSAVFIPENPEFCYVAILGDSPVVVHAPGRPLWIGPLHNARSNLKERARALERGARYMGGYLEDPRDPGAGLQMSRSFGDRTLSRILDRQPDLFKVPLGRGSWVFLATDGVLDGDDLDFEGQLKHIAQAIQNGQDAQDLIQDAVRRITGDNVTVLLWRAGEDGGLPRSS